MKQATRCINGHPYTGKLCQECGYIFPFKAGDTFKDFKIKKRCVSKTRLHLYQATQQGKDFLLWEGREFFQFAKRQELLGLWNQLTPPDTLPLEHWFIEDAPQEQGSLFYIVQAHQMPEQPCTLNELIEQTGLLSPESIHSILLSALNLTQVLESEYIIYNGFSSAHLFIEDAQLLWFPPIFSQRYTGPGLLSPLIQLGFSPPEQIRTGKIFRETDRYGIAMLLFHLLTGLSPALWAPDVPSMQRFKYIWDESLITFFNDLLQPRSDHSIQSLITRWQNIEIKIKAPEQYERYCDERKAFYTALHDFQNNEYGNAYQTLSTLFEPYFHNPHIYRIAAKILWKENEKQKSMAFYQKAIQAEQLGTFYLDIGNLYQSEKVFDKSTVAFKKSLGYIPYSHEPYVGIGINDIENQRYQNAKVWLTRANNIKPSHAAFYGLKLIENQLNPPLSHELLSPSQENSPVSLTTNSASLQFNNAKEELKTNYLHQTCPQGHQSPYYANDCLECEYSFVFLKDQNVFKNKYTIYEVLNQRDTLNKINASTFIAKENATGDHYFLKQMAYYPSNYVRFIKEQKILKQCDHPKIPKLLGAFQERHSYCLILEYKKGTPLNTYIEEHGPLSEEHVRVIFLQLVEILFHLQSAHIIHCDIKPANLLLNPETWEVSLIDFDIAVYSEKPPEEYINTIGASKFYAPLEQRESHRVNWQTDLYALGLTSIFLLTGLTPELFYYNNKKQYAHWQSYAEISLSFAKIIDRLIEAKPIKRKYKHVQDILTWLAPLKTEPSLPLAEKQKSLSKLYTSIKERTDNNFETILTEHKGAKAYYLVGLKYLYQEEYYKASGFLEKAVTLDPEWINAYWDLSKTYIETKRLGKAFSILNNALTINSKDTRSYHLLGQLHLHLKEFKEALITLRKATDLAPLNHRILADYAKSLFFTQNLTLCRKICFKVLSIKPTYFKVYQLLQMVSAVEGHLEEAIKYGEIAVKYYPQELNLRYDLGLSYYKHNQFEKAIEQFEIYLSLPNPSIESIHYFLGSAYLMRGDFKDALKHLKQAETKGKHRDIIQKKIEVIEIALENEKQIVTL